MELPGSHYTTETGDLVLKDRKLHYTDSAGGSLIASILFEEIFYTKDFAKYKIWCIDKPLSVKDLKEPNSVTFANLVHVTNLNEAISFIWHEVNSNNCKHALRKIDASISNFKKNNCGSK